MRVRIAHETVYRYASPANAVIQTLRLTPRNFEGQHVSNWRIDVDQDCRLEAQEDAFGNLTHTFTAAGPIEALTVRVDGLVETSDNAGVVRGAVERFPPALFLRETDLTRADAAIRAFAETIAETAGREPLPLLHALMEATHSRLAYDRTAEPSEAAAGVAFSRKRGDERDFAHVFIAAARYLGVPARYVGGYYLGRPAGEDAAHSWAEAHVDGLGWVAFDATIPACPTKAHIRIATGLDHLSAAPVRSARYGGDGEVASVKVSIDQAARQVQS